MGLKKGQTNNPNGRPKAEDEPTLEEKNAKRKADRLKFKENEKKRQQQAKERIAVRKSAKKAAKKHNKARTSSTKKELIAAIANAELR